MNTKHIFLEGKTIYMRALEESDLKGNYFQWLNDEEVCRFNSHAIFPNTEKKMRDYLEFSATTQNAVVLAIVFKQNDLHIGNISLQSIHWINRSAEIAFLLGEKDYWGKGIMYEAGKLIINYGFERLNLHRIYCGTSSENVAMQKLAVKLGMKQEGKRKDAMFKNGRYTDVLEYGMIALDSK